MTGNRITTTLAPGSGERGSASAPPPPAAGSLGTAPSNTVPSNCNPPTRTRILRTGIDSLYLSYTGDLSHESSVRLAALKELAQSPHPGTASLAQMELATHTFEVGDKGRSIFPYLLRDGWYDLQVSKEGAVNKPMAFVRIASGLLTTKSLPFIMDDLEAVIADLGDAHGPAGLSRVDLCADFTTDYPLHEIRDVQWITRARNISRYTESKLFTGFSIGAGGDMSARLYNKTIELRKNPRPYLEDLWVKAGWDDWEDVWRLEFQFKRTVLRQFGVTTSTDLAEHLAGLWHYATSQWLRLAIPSLTDTTQSRWPTSPLWEVLQGASWSGEPQLSRVDIDKGRPPSDKTLFENGLSGLTSFMAREGFVLPEDGIPAYYKAAREYHDARQHYTGEDYLSYLAKKVRHKQKLYNSAVNVPLGDGPHPAESAVIQDRKKAADTYRRGKDGE